MIHSIHLTGLTEKQLAAVSEVAGILSIRIERSGIPVNCKKQGKGIRISYDEVQVTITYEQEHQLIRALSRFLENIRRGERVEINEMPVYEQLGFMVDCSRNAVLNHEGYKELIRRLALMGYSTVQLYTEDTYELEGYPYFGYLRGRYTGEQIREMDQYAALFGIELVPCIQTLAHLGQALKWQAHAPLVDFQDILLIDDPRTYELIDRMFAFMATHLSSRRINIGMDEAHMMGLGKYLDKHGYQDRSSLMLKHFSTVMEIARKYGFRTMMWSDMFFRLASSGEYYDAESPISPDIVKLIPEEVTLIYWDYYSETQEKYDGMLRKHKQLNDHIGFAGGAWKWMGFAPNNEFSRKVSLLAHDSCVKHGIQEVLITAWEITVLKLPSSRFFLPFNFGRSCATRDVSWRIMSKKDSVAACKAIMMTLWHSMRPTWFQEIRHLGDVLSIRLNTCFIKIFCVVCSIDMLFLPCIRSIISKVRKSSNRRSLAICLGNPYSLYKPAYVACLK